MAITSTIATPKQRALLEWYESETGIETMHQDELDGGEIARAELVRSNFCWFRVWSMALLSRLDDQLLASADRDDLAGSWLAARALREKARLHALIKLESQ